MVVISNDDTSVKVLCHINWHNFFNVSGTFAGRSLINAVAAIFYTYKQDLCVSFMYL